MSESESEDDEDDASSHMEITSSEEEEDDVTSNDNEPVVQKHISREKVAAEKMIELSSEESSEGSGKFISVEKLFCQSSSKTTVNFFSWQSIYCWISKIR